MAVAYAIAAAALLPASAAQAASKLVTFDDLPAGTSVTEQYRTSHGVYFIGQADFGYKPVVRTAAAQARSEDKVADIRTCVGGSDVCGEFGVNGRARGRLTTSATTVSAYVGLIDERSNPADPPRTATLRLRAYTASGAQVGLQAAATVTEGAAFNTKLEVTSPAPNIDYFELDTPAGDQGKFVALDNLGSLPPTSRPLLTSGWRRARASSRSSRALRSTTRSSSRA